MNPQVFQQQVQQQAAQALQLFASLQEPTPTAANMPTWVISHGL
jgi:hypothetical protein